MHLHIREVVEIKKECDHWSVFHKDQGVIMTFVKKNLKPKNYAKKRVLRHICYSATKVRKWFEKELNE